MWCELPIMRARFARFQMGGRDLLTGKNIYTYSLHSKHE